MDIRNLLTYLDEDIVSYILTINEIIDGHLPQPEGTRVDDADEEDDSQEVAPMSTKEASNMLQSLKTLWRMQEKVSMFMTRQMVQKSINDFFQLI
jgi:hypothetical protein